MGIHDVACPLCGPERRAPGNRIRKVLRVWYVSPGFASFQCARCGESGWVRDGEKRTINTASYSRVQTEFKARQKTAAAERLRKAQWLWQHRESILGSPAETYLRGARAYQGPLPPTLGFLPACGEYPAAMIGAFGIPDEPEPNMLQAPTPIAGVHVTRLLPDGSNRLRDEKAKIMIGFSTGNPTVLAPWTDGLGLIITEGIEDALSAHEATGLCAWAAGCASRLPALADVVPTWTEVVTILADNDREGRRHAAVLSQKLTERAIEVRVIVLDEHVGVASDAR
jgi:hypothetical protein